MEEAHILVVDDDEIVARTIERSLRAGGFHVSVVHSGVEACVRTPWATQSGNCCRLWG